MRRVVLSGLGFRSLTPGLWGCVIGHGRLRARGLWALGPLIADSPEDLPSAKCLPKLDDGQGPRASFRVEHWSRQCTRVFPESMAKGSSVGFMGVIIMRVIAKSYQSSSESLHRVIIIIIMRLIAQSHSRESLARNNAHESHLRGAMLVRVTGEEQCS